MAEPLSVIGSATSIAGLADVSCRLAGAVYKSFRALKEAPQSMQRLATELRHLHVLLQEVDRLVTRYSTSLSVTEDALSVDVLGSLLQECQAELTEIQNTTTIFQQKLSKFKNVAKNIKWVFDERKINRHHESIKTLAQRVDTALLIAGRHQGITNRARDKQLHVQISGVGGDVQASAIETRSFLSTEVNNVRNSIEEVNVEVLNTRDTLQANLNQKLQKLERNVTNLESMLSLLSLKQRELRIPCSLSALAQHSNLEAMMLSLTMMKSSLDSAIANLRSESSTRLSDDQICLLLNEYTNLVTFCREAASMRSGQSSRQIRDHEDRSREAADAGLIPRGYYLDVSNCTEPTSTLRRQRRRIFHDSRVGRLLLTLEEETGDCNNLPTSVVGVSFCFIPNLQVNDTGIYALFKKKMQMERGPAITRYLREIRILHDEDSTLQAFRHIADRDDLPGLQRMLSYGEIRPWDKDGRGRNLLCIAASEHRFSGSSVLDYLLQGGWDAENSHPFQQTLWVRYFWKGGPSALQGMQNSIQLSKRGLESDLDFEDPDFESLSFKGVGFEDLGLGMEALQNHPIDALLGFLTSCRSLDLEYKDIRFGETILLQAAANVRSGLVVQVLLKHGADFMAQDRSGRSPLHLTLCPRRGCSRLSARHMKAKLVHLLRAGCPVHATDALGRTPSDLARGPLSPLGSKIWKSALKEVDMLDEKMGLLKQEVECAMFEDEGHLQDQKPLEPQNFDDWDQFEAENAETVSENDIEDFNAKILQITRQTIFPHTAMTHDGTTIASGQHHIWI